MTYVIIVYNGSMYIYEFNSENLFIDETITVYERIREAMM